MIDRDLTKEPYIPSARDAVVAYFGRIESGGLRCYCVRCNDKCPLGPAYPDTKEPSKVYGDLFVAEPCEIEKIDDGDKCDMCGVKLLELSRQCQEEHDTQQAQWARTSAPTVLIEYGIPGAIRCRVY